MNSTENIMVDLSGLEEGEETAVQTSVTSQATTAEAPKTEAETPKAETPEPPATEEPTNTEANPPAEPAPDATPTDDSEPQFTEAEQKVLKQMSPYARDFAIARVKELQKERAERIKLVDEVKALREQKEAARSNVYESENAYVLNPDYQEAAMAVNNYKKAARHYENQKALAIDGDPVTFITGVDEDGELTFSEPMKPTGKVIATLDRETLKIARGYDKAQGVVSRISTEHSANHGKFRERVNAMSSAMIPQWDAITKANPAAATSHKATIDTLTKMGFDPQVSPLVDTVARLYAVAELLGTKLEAANKSLASAKSVNSVAKVVGPTNGQHVDAGGRVAKARPGHVEITDDDLARY